jgi:hypothetical protein
MKELRCEKRKETTAKIAKYWIQATLITSDAAGEYLPRDRVGESERSA